jgi:hypothetical protein
MRDDRDGSVRGLACDVNVGTKGLAKRVGWSVAEFE